MNYPIGVLPHPLDGRKEGSGTVCLGAAMETLIENFNEGKEESDRIAPLPSRPVSYSHRIQATAEKALATSTMLRPFLGVRSYREISCAISPGDLANEMAMAEAIISTKFPHVKTTVGDWLAHEAVLNKLRGLKRHKSPRTQSCGRDGNGVVATPQINNSTKKKNRSNRLMIKKSKKSKRLLKKKSGAGACSAKRPPINFSDDEIVEHDEGVSHYTSVGTEEEEILKLEEVLAKKKRAIAAKRNTVRMKAEVSSAGKRLISSETDTD